MFKNEFDLFKNPTLLCNLAIMKKIRELSTPDSNLNVLWEYWYCKCFINSESELMSDSIEKSTSTFYKFPNLPHMTLLLP